MTFHLWFLQFHILPHGHRKAADGYCFTFINTYHVHKISKKAIKLKQSSHQCPLSLQTPAQIHDATAALSEGSPPWLDQTNQVSSSAPSDLWIAPELLDWHWSCCWWLSSSNDTTEEAKMAWESQQMFKPKTDGGWIHLGWNLGAPQEVFKTRQFGSTLLDSWTD